MSEQHNDDPNDTLKDKFKQSIDSIKKNEKVEEIYKYAQANTKDTIAYVLMAAGLLLMLFHVSLGGVLVGLIFGLYFGTEIYNIFATHQQFIQNQGPVRSLILAGLLLGLFIAAPFLFIAGAVAALIRQFFFPNK